MMETLPLPDNVTIRAVPGPSVVIGCDPELFAVNSKGRVMGSDRVLGNVKDHLVVRDGVQFELHPDPTTCRANVGNSLKAAILNMDAYIKRVDPKARISFKQLVTVTKGELLGLSEEARRLGCAPSENIYGHKTPEIDGMVYRKRTGAGHIHLGFDPKSYKMTTERTVKLLDILVGNTCVLLDRDPAAVERRKNYGKAGEYRLPKHGLEYRTPSNFWLRSYQLFSLVSALSRTAVRASSLPYFKGSKSHGNNGYFMDMDDRLLDNVSDEQIQHAINQNDYQAAWDIWQKVVRPVLWELSAYEGVYHNNLKDFDFFLTKPIEQWFPTDPLVHWKTVPEGHGTGWENFLEHIVQPQRLGAEALSEAPKGAAAKIRVRTEVK